MLERNRFQKPAVTFDCPVKKTWLFLMQTIFHTEHVAEEL